MTSRGDGRTVDAEILHPAISPPANEQVSPATRPFLETNSAKHRGGWADAATIIDDAVPGRVVSLEPDAPVPMVEPPPPLFDLLGYNPALSNIIWLIGSNDQFGMTSLEWFPTLPHRATRGLVTGFGVHFLDGPVQTDMPPRLFDFAIGYQWRERINSDFALDVALRVGAYSDFEASAGNIRYPGHAVSYTRLSPGFELAFGVDYLDRDDISLLPVAGAIWTPNDNVRIEAVFPRPRAAVRLAGSNRWAYVRGQLGGGTWAIERANLTPDTATYRDLRLALGLESLDAEGASAIEVGYVFARELSYRTGVGNFEPQDVVMLNLTTAF
jgi:hypothetical protein